jgi:hypothetical protein
MANFSCLFLFFLLFKHMKAQQFEQILLNAPSGKHPKGVITHSQFHLDSKFENYPEINHANKTYISRCYPTGGYYHIDDELRERYERDVQSLLLSFNTCSALYSWQTKIVHNAVIWRESSGRCRPNLPQPRIWNDNELNGVTAAVEMAIFDSSSIWGDAYFHSTFEKFLPLGIVRDLLENNEKVFIIVENVKSFLIEQLRLVGINEDRLIIVKGITDAVKVKKLIVPSLTLCGWQSPGIALSMQKWIQGFNYQLYDKSKQAEKKLHILVIDRKSPTSQNCNRCLLNTNELIDNIHVLFPNIIVTRFHADPSDSEDNQLSMKSTMELFSKVDIVISPHGAALSNFIFCPSNSVMIEILNISPPNFCFASLARSLGANYYALAPLNLTRINISKVTAILFKLLNF